MAPDMRVGMRFLNSRWSLPKMLSHLIIYGQTGCQPKGSKVMMANGEWKNIEEIHINDEVLSPQKDGSYIFAKVLNVTSWYSDNNYSLLELNRNKKELYKCSYNHLIPVNHRSIPRINNERKSKNRIWTIKHYKAEELYLMSEERRNHDSIGFTCPYIPSFKNKKNCEIEPYCRMAISIKKSEPCKVYGFTLDSNSGWYITDNFMVTHNSGKSQSLKSLAERAYLRGIKVFDIYSGGAQEICYFSLKSNHPFWGNREFKYGNSKPLKAMEFPTKVLIPVNPKTIPEELPDIFQPFTIPINSITEKDLKAVLGQQLTKNEVALWRKVQPQINRNTTLPELLIMIVKAQKSDNKLTPGIHATGVSSIYNMFSGFNSTMIFSSGRNQLALNLRNELSDRKVITGLELKYYPQEYWGFIVGHFIHRIYDLKIQGEIKHPVIIVFREVGDYLMNIGETSSQEASIRYNVIEALRKGRKHQLFLWMDNQTPMNLDIVKSQCEIKICHFVDNTVELENALGDLGAQLLSREDYFTLRKFKKGRCFILEKRGLFAPQILPPLSRMSGDEGSDFNEIWRKEKGNTRFRNIKHDLQPIYDEYEDADLNAKDQMLIMEEEDFLKRAIKRQEKKLITLDERAERFKIKEELKVEKKRKKIEDEILDEEMIELDDIEIKEPDEKSKEDEIVLEIDKPIEESEVILIEERKRDIRESEEEPFLSPY